MAVTEQILKKNRYRISFRKKYPIIVGQNVILFILKDAVRMNFGWCNCVTIYIFCGQKRHPVCLTRSQSSLMISPARISLALLLSIMRDDWRRIRSYAGRARKLRDYPILRILPVHCRGVPRGGFQGFQNVPKQNQLLSAVIEKEALKAKKATLLSLTYKMGRTA